MFGNMRQSDREFTCSDYFNNADKQNRKFDLVCNSNLSMAKEDIQSGYQETFADLMQASRTEDHCSGSC